MEARMNTENTTFQNVTIPAGFAPTKIEGESTVDEGLVIIDEEGNEFVWVPVPDINKFQRTIGVSNGNKELMDGYKEPFADGYPTEETEYNKMYESVRKNEGFYIGRYETGKDEEGNVVVQKDVDVYINIKWGNAMDDETGGAVEKAKGFKKGKAYENSVTSTLVYGIQWDATMQFFDSNYIEGKYDIENSYISNSTGKGNYNEDANTNSWKGQLAKTGSSPDYKVKNIYDMAGNAWEWTMEAHGSDRRVYRGGCYYYSSFLRPASSHGYNLSFTTGEDMGFRIALYIGL